MSVKVMFVARRRISGVIGAALLRFFSAEAWVGRSELGGVGVGAGPGVEEVEQMKWPSNGDGIAQLKYVGTHMQTAVAQCTSLSDGAEYEAEHGSWDRV